MTTNPNTESGILREMFHGLRELRREEYHDNPMTTPIEENWEERVDGSDVFWKVIRRNLTPETHEWIKNYIRTLLAQQREALLKEVEETLNQASKYTVEMHEDGTYSEDPRDNQLIQLVQDETLSRFQTLREKGEIV